MPTIDGTMPTAPAMPGAPAALPADGAVAASGAPLGTTAGAPDDKKSKEPQKGDFDAGGQVRLPNGPDAEGKYATYNWIGLDVKGKYYLLKSVTVNATIPLAVHHPDTLMDGSQPKMIGGFTAQLDARLPRILGGGLTFGYMHEGAALQSEKDFPKFVGDFKPIMAVSMITKFKMGRAVDFSFVPQWVYQSGTMDSHTAIQVPLALIIRLGSLLETSVDLGVYTGDHYHLSGDAGGRIAAGGSLTVKIGPIKAHAGLGVASLLTGGDYPTIRDSLYVDLNVKYAK